MKILIEMNNANPQLGSVASTVDIVEQLTERDFEFVFCGNLTPSFLNMPALQKNKKMNSNSIQFSKWNILHYLLSTFKWIANLLILKPHIVIQNYSGWGQSLCLAAHILNIPVLARAGGSYDKRNPSNKWINGYLAYNKYHARQLLNSPLAERVFITGHPFRPKHLKNGDDTLGSTNKVMPTLLFLGQLEKRKGLSTLVEAFSQMKEVAKLQIIGGDWNSDGYPKEIRDMITKLNIGDNIELINHQTDVVKWLHQSDVFVFPSVNDTHPRVLTEAMFVGLPVVSVNSGGIPEMVEDKVCGLLVEPDDSKALARAMDEVTKSPSLRRKLGNAGFIRSREKLTSSRTIERYEDVFRSFQKAK